MARSYYPLGQTYTPREVLSLAYGDTPHPLAPEQVECKRLTKDGTICYELRKGHRYGKDLWTVLFAQVIKGKPTPMRDESKSFTTKSAARDWIDTVEQAGQAS